MIFTPEQVPLVVEVELARANPALAVLSALCHGGDPEVDAMFAALAAALQALGPRSAILYYDIVVRHEAPCDRVGVRDLHRVAVAAAA